MKKWTRWLWLAGSVGVATLAAAWRWPDSTHAIGVLRQGGGSARHPVTLTPGPTRYMLVVTAPVIPPWRGDARLAIEGDPLLDFKTELSGPVLDLGLHHLPRLDGRVLRGLRAGDRIALWVQIDAPQAAYHGQQLRLTMRDERTAEPLLTLPVVLGGKGDGHGHHH